MLYIYIRSLFELGIIRHEHIFQMNECARSNIICKTIKDEEEVYARALRL